MRLTLTRYSWFFLLCWSFLLSHYVLLGVKIYEVDFPIGKEQGIDPSSSISADTLQRILVGVEKGNRENIYFYGLLKLYGISMNKDIHGAAQQFLRASKLGHKDATTAYGSLHLGSFGSPNYMEAMKYFREGVTLGDMVSVQRYFFLQSFLTKSMLECALVTWIVSSNCCFPHILFIA